MPLSQVKETMHNGNATQELEAIRHDMEMLRSDMHDLARTVRQDGPARMSHFKERLYEMGKNIEQGAQHRLHDACDVVRQQSTRAVEKTRETVEHRPLTYLAGAFATGWIVSFLLRRRRREQ